MDVVASVFEMSDDDCVDGQQGDGNGGSDEDIQEYRMSDCDESQRRDSNRPAAVAALSFSLLTAVRHD